jgi:pyridoxamine 5'-phosphate oxidase family protein
MSDANASDAGTVISSETGVVPTPGELEYLTSERRLARLATIDADGLPHVVPVGWRYDAASGTFTVSGRDFARTKKFQNVQRRPVAALLVDDVLPPWRPRAVLVQGRAQALASAEAGPGASEAAIRIHPVRILSWGLPAVA